eukprot:jgi/Psemu1/34234/gm1.34234_g
MSNYSTVEIGAGIMVVNKICFFVTLSRHIQQFATVKMNSNAKAATLAKCIKTVQKSYAKSGFSVTMVAMDKQFEPIQERQIEQLGITPNFATNDEHVPEIKQYIWTIEKRSSILAESARKGVQYSTSDTEPPNNCYKDDPGGLRQTPKATVWRAPRADTSTSHKWIVGAIALCPSSGGNHQGGYNFYSLQTGQVLSRNTCTPLPMPGEVITRIHDMAGTSSTPTGTVFHDTRAGNPIEDDNDENGNMVPPPEAYDWSNVYGIAFKFQSDNNPQEVLSLNGSYAETVPLTAPEISTLFTSDANDEGTRTLGLAPVTALREAFCNSITLDMDNIDELAKGHIAQQLLDSCPVRFVKPGSPNQRIGCDDEDDDDLNDMEPPPLLIPRPENTTTTTASDADEEEEAHKGNQNNDSRSDPEFEAPISTADTNPNEDAPGHNTKKDDPPVISENGNNTKIDVPACKESSPTHKGEHHQGHDLPQNRNLKYDHLKTVGFTYMMLGNAKEQLQAQTHAINAILVAYYNNKDGSACYKQVHEMLQTQYGLKITRLREFRSCGLNGSMLCDHFQSGAAAFNAYLFSGDPIASLVILVYKNVIPNGEPFLCLQVIPGPENLGHFAVYPSQLLLILSLPPPIELLVFGFCLPDDNKAAAPSCPSGVRQEGQPCSMTFHIRVHRKDRTHVPVQHPDPIYSKDDKGQRSYCSS